MAKQQATDSTTQEFLDIYDITNNLVIMKDGAASIVLTVNAMNFGLLAEAEQDAVIYTYASLLNSLNYPIQILIQSQTKDATSYLKILEQQEQKIASKEKRERISRYRQFVSELIKERNVLDKKFYVVVPASALELGLLTPQSVLPGSKTLDVSTIDRSVVLEKARTILEPRRDHLLAQFARIGLFARQLATQEIIQVFYVNYNPEAAEGQQLTNSTAYSSPIVQASMIGGATNFAPTEATTEAATIAEQTVNELLQEEVVGKPSPAVPSVAHPVAQPEDQSVPQTINEPRPSEQVVEELAEAPTTPTTAVQAAPVVQTPATQPPAASKLPPLPEI